MSKKFLVILIPCFLVIGGYLFLRYYLKRSIRKAEKETGQIIPSIDSLGGEKVSTADLRPLFIKRLQLLIKAETNGLYDLSVGDMKADMLASSISLENVSVQFSVTSLDSLKKINKEPATVFSITFNEILIEGINLDDVINDNMDYDQVKLIRPLIKIHHLAKADKKNRNEEEFQQRFFKGIKTFSLKKLIIEGGTIITYNNLEKEEPGKLNNIEVNMTDILIDSVSRKDANRFFFAKQATVSFKNYYLQTTSGLYDLKVGDIIIKAPQQTITLANLSFSSPFSRQQFVSKQKFSRELYHLVLPFVTINNVNWQALVNRKEIVADGIDIRNGSMSIFLDRSLTAKSKVGNFPSQLLMKIPLKMNIDKLAIAGLNFSYEEYNPLSKQNGTIYFDNIILNVTNISNNKAKKARPMIAKGTALFMHSVPMQAEFNFDMMDYKSGKFSSTIKTNGFDGSSINSFAMPMALMKVEKGTLQGAEARIQGDQWNASGEVMVLYNDLKLSMLEKDAGKKELDKKDFTSFIANHFILKEDNPKKGDQPRREKTSFRRIPEGGFFMLVWKTMMVGILKTIGAPEKIAYKTVASQEKK